MAAIDAAAIEVHFASPLTMAFCGRSDSGRGNASSSRKSGAIDRLSRALNMASRTAGAMPRRSISAAEADPVEMAAAASTSLGRTVFRCDGVSLLESRTNPVQGPLMAPEKTAAPATTGPAIGPLPASSIPATVE